MGFAHLKDRTYYEEKFFNWLTTHNIKPPSGKAFVNFKFYYFFLLTSFLAFPNRLALREVVGEFRRQRR
jgi:hypothetical protein